MVYVTRTINDIIYRYFFVTIFVTKGFSKYQKGKNMIINGTVRLSVNNHGLEMYFPIMKVFQLPRNFCSAG